jgi:adenylosuccinate lyase
MTRDDAYRIVQRAARQSVETSMDFRTVLEADSEVTMSEDELNVAFDLDRMLRHRTRYLEALKGIGSP